MRLNHRSWKLIQWILLHQIIAGLDVHLFRSFIVGHISVGEGKKHWKERLVRTPVALHLSEKWLLYIFLIVHGKSLDILFIAPLLYTAQETFLGAVLTGLIRIIEKALEISNLSQGWTYTTLQSATMLALVGAFVAVPVISNLPSAELEC
jgi:hypothetical protein